MRSLLCLVALMVSACAQAKKPPPAPSMVQKVDAEDLADSEIIAAEINAAQAKGKKFNAQMRKKYHLVDGDKIEADGTIKRKPPAK